MSFFSLQFTSLLQITRHPMIPNHLNQLKSCVVSYEDVWCIICLRVRVCVQFECNGFTRPADLRVSDPILEFCPFHQHEGNTELCFRSNIPARSALQINLIPHNKPPTATALLPHFFILFASVQFVIHRMHLFTQFHIVTINMIAYAIPFLSCTNHNCLPTCIRILSQLSPVSEVCGLLLLVI